ncbi:hypothetical protein BDR07DRAFT_1452269 [Suillus spraguei]|nr:hypothetical protein BDR07DRAFT_1452269 [Suillus spraguei]
MLMLIKTKTHENYGAGLLCFHQYCDSCSIPEKSRMPTSDQLLASFIASWAGKVATTTAQNWVAGLHFWHNLHGAPWFGHGLLCSAMAGLAKVVPESSKCPCWPPVTLKHMHALFRGLDLSNTFDAAVFAVACMAFWCCCRLGELVINSLTLFDSDKHISRSTLIFCHSLLNQIPFTIFYIPWAKTTHGEVMVLDHHLSSNSKVPPTAPLFAYETAGGGWAPMTRPWLLASRCNQVWRDTGLSELMGIPPDVVAMQGCWKSCTFLEYWHKIESILPLFVTSSFTDAHISMVHSSMDLFAHHYK